MSRITKIIALGAALAALAVLVVPGREGSEASAGGDSRPNVVVLQTDDQALADLAAMANTQRLLVDRGTSFSTHITPFSLCCPSRASMMTGAYPHNHGVISNFPPDGGYGAFQDDEDRFIGAWLKESGYHTTHIGKYLNGYGLWNNPHAAVPPGWSEWRGSADPSTYQFWGYRLNEPDGSNVYGDFGVEDPQMYSTDVYAGKAVDVIRREAVRPGPFYLQVAFLAPHTERVPTVELTPEELEDEESNITTIRPPRPAPRHQGAFSDLPLPMDPSFNEADVSDKASIIQGLASFDDAEVAELEEDNQLRWETLLAVDEAVTSVVNALRRTGQLSNTYIVFMGDNGYVLGQHRLSKGKYFPYEPALRIPLVVRGPGVRQGRTVSTLVSIIDVAPTILDYAGVAPTGRTPDGISLRGTLGGLVPPRRSIHLESGPQQGPNGEQLPLFSGVRTARYAYWVYEGDVGEELYDLARDPYQLQSVHNDPRYAATRTALIAEAARLEACSGAACQTQTPRIPAPTN